MVEIRRLTEQELEALKSEFITFLIVQGIDADEWMRMKGDESFKAVNLIDQFSDMIFTNVLSKIGYLEHFDGISLKLFKCDEDEIHLIMLTSEMQFEHLESMVNAMNKQPFLFSISKTSKPFKHHKLKELYIMTQQGCQISDGTLFNIYNE